MKQIFQNLKTGATEVVEVPCPVPGKGQVLIQSTCSLISAGTEMMLVEFSRAGWIAKARQQPERVKQVLDKIRTDGIIPTISAVRSRLDQPLPLGYCNAGKVTALGDDVKGFQIGDRVASNGYHADYVVVPKNLCVRIPENVTDEEAGSTVMGAIALQGIRLAEVKLGEVVAVIGLGLLGQLAVQMLKASGCTVIGMDLNPHRAELARELGADAVSTTSESLRELSLQLSSGFGVDSVIISADTSSNEPVLLAGEIARDRGVVVAVGSVGMQIPRRIFYQKELDFRISRSYGPGRYDVEYEEKGHDYPIGYVRWTENRNMQAFLKLLSEGKVNVRRLITHRFPIDDASEAYEMISKKKEPYLGILFTYPSVEEKTIHQRTIQLKKPDKPDRLEKPEKRDRPERPDKITIGLLGAGNFATSTLLPALKKVPDVEFIGICTATGLKARHAGDRFGFCYCTTEEDKILNDQNINTVVIATRHHLHARQIISAFKAGKNVFCEKPLCLNEKELDGIVHIYNQINQKNQTDQINEKNQKDQINQILMVGFNRRFAPMVDKLKSFFCDVREPLFMHYRVNAGYIPPEHWVHDLEQGGGRIIGEICHFVDLLTYQANALPVRVQAKKLANSGRYQDDNLLIDLEFENGSLGCISYLACGDKSFSKERLEVFGGQKTAVLDNFRRLELRGHGRKKLFRSLLQQDKGHQKEWKAFLKAVQMNGPLPIPLEQMISTTLVTFLIIESVRSGKSMPVELNRFFQIVNN